jgi:LysR family transcriptional activator of nhaA
MNFKHLHYFWVAARAGGIVRAGEQLHISPQTLSGQIKLLEQALDKKLFRKSGRNIELTDAGRLVLSYADEIFSLGSELESEVRRDDESGTQMRFRVGIADSVPKAVAYRLLEPALGPSLSLRMICHEGKLHALLSQLAVHRLDLVIADAPIPADVNIKAFNHRLGRSTLSCFGTHTLTQGSRRFPALLSQVPVLLPGTESAVRRKLDHWLASHAISPHIIGEFDDGAMTMAFGREGRGVLFAPTVLESQLEAEHKLAVIGQIDDIVEEFFAISIERRISHPAVSMIMDAARSELFNA